MENALTTKRHVATDRSAKPPRLYTPYMKTCASHCWSVQVAPRPYTVISSRLGRPFSTTSRPAMRLSQLSLTTSAGGKISRKMRPNPARRTTRMYSSSANAADAMHALFVGVDGALHEPVLVRDARRLGAVLHAELAVDVREVELHGLRRDPELLRDLVVREPARERAENGELALRETEGLWRSRARRPRRRLRCGRFPRAPGVASPAGRPG